ncbi:methyltransferase domain-containing protein [Streptomyces tricolor]|nr:methyltransferase domain-containing protein [Streptomyces tricolor]
MLDLGSGSGAAAAAIARAGAARVHGVDNGRQTLRWAERHYASADGRVSFALGDYSVLSPRELLATAPGEPPRPLVVTSNPAYVAAARSGGPHPSLDQRRRGRSEVGRVHHRPRPRPGRGPGADHRLLLDAARAAALLAEAGYRIAAVTLCPLPFGAFTRAHPERVLALEERGEAVLWRSGPDPLAYFVVGLACRRADAAGQPDGGQPGGGQELLDLLHTAARSATTRLESLDAPGRGPAALAGTRPGSAARSRPPPLVTHPPREPPPCPRPSRRPRNPSYRPKPPRRSPPSASPSAPWSTASTSVRPRLRARAAWRAALYAGGADQRGPRTSAPTSCRRPPSCWPGPPGTGSGCGPTSGSARWTTPRTRPASARAPAPRTPGRTTTPLGQAGIADLVKRFYGGLFDALTALTGVPYTVETYTRQQESPAFREEFLASLGRWEGAALDAGAVQRAGAGRFPLPRVRLAAEVRRAHRTPRRGRPAGPVRRRLPRPRTVRDRRTARRRGPGSAWTTLHRNLVKERLADRG